MRLKISSVAFAFCVIVSISTGCYRSKASQPLQESNVASNALNVNTATAKELTAIPNIGEKLAERIVEFREKNGRFERPEDLLLVSGISDKRFREIRNMIRTE